MKGLLLRWLIQTIAIYAAANLLDGIEVSGFGPALLTAAVLGILNAFLRPVLLLLTLPINILSLGLFTFVINALMLKLADVVIAGLTITGFWPALVASLVISLVSWLLSLFVNDKGQIGVVEMRRGRNGEWS